MTTADPSAIELSVRAHTALADDSTLSPLDELRHRTEIRDALLRFGLGQDLQDASLFASAFTIDAELDFRPAASRWGSAPPVMRGRDNIVSTILAMFEGRVATTHQISNERISLGGETARLTAVVEAQHLLEPGRSHGVLLVNRYDVGLVRSRRQWLMHRVRIENIWFTGDPHSIFG